MDDHKPCLKRALLPGFDVALLSALKTSDKACWMDWDLVTGDWFWTLISLCLQIARDSMMDHYHPQDKYKTGWWFGTWILLSILYGMSSFPLTNSYFSRWLLHHQAEKSKHPAKWCPCSTSGFVVDIFIICLLGAFLNQQTLYKHSNWMR